MDVNCQQGLPRHHQVRLPKALNELGHNKRLRYDCFDPRGVSRIVHNDCIIVIVGKAICDYKWTSQLTDICAKKFDAIYSFDTLFTRTNYGRERSHLRP